MPIQPRLVIAGYLHHIILRGNNRSAIFYNDKDRRFFINCFKDEYLLACAGYIELSPVRARLVSDPQDYLWPSFRLRADS